MPRSVFCCRKIVICSLVLVSASFGFAEAMQSDEAGQAAAVKTVLTRQVEDWNRGDLSAFVQSYAARCTLVGNGVSELSREQVLAHYREKYPSPQSRGKLTFADLSVHLLDAQTAIATGRWRVQRDAQAGGLVSGVFSVVLKLSDGSWQIVLDHTSSTKQ